MPPRTSWKRKLAISLVSLAVFAAIGYGVSIVSRSRGLYAEVKNGSPGGARLWFLGRRWTPESKPVSAPAEAAPGRPAGAADPFAPTNMGLIPTPYFVRTKSSIELHPPAFDTIAFDLTIAEYKSSPRG